MHLSEQVWMAAASYYIVITSSNTYLKYFNSDANVSFATKIFNIVETLTITTTLNVHEKMEKTR